ncbi:MAG: helix-turn-helix domain-containing protein [Eubacterium sp.]|nr:helix-turn-helix domain-containing protein [Eubacterium sp.]
MTITIEMILTSFFADHPEAEAPFSNGEKEIIGLRLLPEDLSTLDQDYLYVTDQGQLSLLSDIDQDVSIVCFANRNSLGGSNTEKADSPSPNNTTVLQSPFELAHGFNDLQSHFSAFADWERKLDFAVFQDAPFQELINIAEEKIASAMLLYDPALKLLAQSVFQPDVNSPFYPEAIRSGYLNMETVKFLEKQNYFETLNDQGLAFSKDDTDKTPAYFRTVKISNQLAVYCVLLFTDKLPRIYEKQLFDVLCDAVERILKKRHTTFLRDRSVTDYLLMDLLENPDTSPEQIKERIYYSELPFEGNFVLTLIESDVSKKSAEQFFLQQLRNNMVNSQIFSWHDAVIILHQIPSAQLPNYREYLTTFLQSLLNSFSHQKMQVYFSRPFFTISNFPGAYKQAANMREFATPAAGSKIPFFFFEDYVVQDLIYQNPVRDQVSYYCEPCLLDLIKKDTKKSRQQVRILYEYLNCDRNYTDVAKKMDMHRNNVIYHIKNLGEQYGLDFDDPKTRLKLLLSFELLNISF